MESGVLMKLDLREAVFYSEIGELPEKKEEKEEYLLCFELNPAVKGNIEPDRGAFLEEMVFTGRKTGETEAAKGGITALPAGEYLFTQYKKALNREEWLDMAVEQHKDGLWERYNPENRLYIRFLFEDDNFVTQLFRPLKR